MENIPRRGAVFYRFRGQARDKSLTTSYSLEISEKDFGDNLCQVASGGKFK